MNIYKLLIVVLFVFIIYNLGQGLRHMFNKSNDPKSMAKSLTWRIALSVITFIIILILISSGKIGFNPSPLQ